MMRCIAWVVLSLILVWGGGMAPAAAEIRTHLETPDQMLYQARQTLRDRDRQTWQAIAFKRVTPQGETPLYLRLVAFPGTVDLDQRQPLVIQDTVGQTQRAATAIDEVFTQGPPGSNVVQYRLTAVLPALGGGPQWLRVATTSGGMVELKAPPIVMQEWQAIAQCHRLTCSDPSWQQTPYTSPASP